MNSFRSLLSAALAWLLLAAVPAHAGTVVEYYNAALDHYFITNYAPEIQALDSGVQKGWARTGLSFQTYDTGSAMFASSSPICRFYGSPEYKLDSHFYSASPLECDDVKKKFPKEWLLEADDLFRVHPVDPNTGICPSGTKAVYRLWNKRPDVNHRYTTEAAVVDAMLAKGYVLEGNGNPARPVAFCASSAAPPPPPTGAPVCTIASSSAIPVVGTPVTLTATCSGSPTGYAWVNCSGTGNSCSVSATSPGSVNYAVVATNAVGAGAQVSIALNWQYPASAAPACQISANTIRPALGTSLLLTSNCSHSPASYQWMGCSPLLIDVCNLLSECSSSSSTCSPIGTQAGAVYYALRAVNSAGMSPKVGLTVEWGGGSTPTPPPPTAGNTPVCQISTQPNTSTPAIGTTMTLTAACTGFPTSYAWTGNGCNTTSNTCTTTETSAGRRAYSVAGRNADGVGSPATVLLDWQQPGPPVCTVTASSDYPTLGSTVTLTANCSQSPTSFAWTGCNSSSSTCQATSAMADAVTYSVTATNAYGSGQGSKTVNWGSSPPTGGLCTNVQNAALTLNQGYATGGFGGDATFVGSITIPPGVTQISVGAVEYGDNAPVYRTLSFSTRPCDFRGLVWGAATPMDPTGANYPVAWSHGMGGVSVDYVSVVPGQTYYVNIVNRQFGGETPGRQSCLTPTCNMLVTASRLQ